MKSARLSLCLVVVLLGALRCNAFTWESCSGANAAIKLTKVEMTPDPPTANSLVKIRIQGTAGAKVTDGDVSVKISWAGMQVAQQTLSLCKFLSCPTKAGPITATYENTMPSFVPRGRYGVQVVAKTSGGSDVLCMTASFSV
ncbi:MD-2-related lipid-recognition domain-containing protein [Scenedesmus sp. NREL 46B-D3]|nr:MD-2-related lipid-recognition domain-containing protein [Scenedesmus sp. NREL 46B-D3]